MAMAYHDFDDPMPDAGALLREATRRQFIQQHPSYRQDGKERKYPVTLTPAGLAFMRRKGDG